MSCANVPKQAEERKNDLAREAEKMKSNNVSIGAKLTSALKSTKLLQDNEAVKLKAAQADRARQLKKSTTNPYVLESMKSPQIDAIKAQQKFLASKRETIENVRQLWEEDKVQTSLRNQIQDRQNEYNGIVKQKPVGRSTVPLKSTVELQDILKAANDKLKTKKQKERAAKWDSEKESRKETSLLKLKKTKEDILAGVEKKIKAKELGPDTSRVAALKDEIAKLDEKIAEGKRIKSLVKQIKETEELIKQGPKPKESKIPREDTPEAKALASQLAELQSQVKDTDWRKAQLQEASARNYLNRLDRSNAELQRRIATGDLKPSRTTRKQVVPQGAEEKLQLKEELKAKIQREVEKIEYESRTPIQRAMDFATGFKRFAILSGPKSMAKLTAASTEVAAARTFTETMGYALRRIPVIEKLSQMAPIEGARATSIGRDTSMYFKSLWKGAKEFKGIIKGEGSFLSRKFEVEGGVPDTWLGFPGRLHEAWKNPTRLANYNVAFDRYMNWAERQGIDIGSPEIVNQAELEAFKFANRSIFKEDNALVREYNKVVINARRSQDPGVRTFGFALEQSLPIVKIPSNIVRQIFEYNFGTIPATYKLVKAINKGMETLTPSEADAIMRQFKNGSAGLMMLAFGAAFSDNIGGIYIKGEDRDELEYGQVKIGNFVVPRLLLENPLFACLQVGATMKRYWKAHMDEATGFSEKAGTFAAGAALTALGVVNEVPFLKTIGDLEKMIRGSTRGDITAAEVYARPYIPAALQYVADLNDLEEPIDWNDWGQATKSIISPKATKRAPENPLQAMELAIPWLRKEVPES